MVLLVRTLALGLVLSSALGTAQAQTPPPGSATRPAASQARPFVVFDGTLFKWKPNLVRHGMTPIYCTGTEFWAGQYPRWIKDYPDEHACRALARKVARLQQILVIDIEHWSISTRSTREELLEVNLRRLGQVVDWIKDERPEVKLGFFGLLPDSDYWILCNYGTALKRSDSSPWWRGHRPRFEQEYRLWQASNDYAAVLARKVDYVFPSLYTFYGDREGWQLVAELTIQEARKYGKPVIPFLWMDFHEGGDQKGKAVPADYWRLELETVRRLADGVVIWGGDGKNWAPLAPWWHVTQQFLQGP